MITNPFMAMRLRSYTAQCERMSDEELEAEEQGLDMELQELAAV
jgi:hypothetical protein